MKRLLFNYLLCGMAIAVTILPSCSEYGLDIHQVDDNFYILLGDGGNSGVLFGDTAVLIIDTKMKQGAERLHQWIDDKAKGKKIYIVNTHIHKDHTSGNHLYSNPTIIAGDYGVQFWNAVNSKEDMPNRWLSDTMTLHIDDETVFIQNMGQAHTYDDVVVYLKKHRTLFTGDLVLNKYHPYLDEHVGANVDNYLAVQSKLLDQYPDATVVPGHGDIGESQLIYDFRAYLYDLKDAALNPDKEEEIREHYLDYLSFPVNKAGFDQAVAYIRRSETLRM